MYTKTPTSSCRWALLGTDLDVASARPKPPDGRTWSQRAAEMCVPPAGQNSLHLAAQFVRFPQPVSSSGESVTFALTPVHSLINRTYPKKHDLFSILQTPYSRLHILRAPLCSARSVSTISSAGITRSLTRRQVSLDNATVGMLRELLESILQIEQLRVPCTMPRRLVKPWHVGRLYGEAVSKDGVCLFETRPSPMARRAIPQHTKSHSVSLPI